MVSLSMVLAAVLATAGHDGVTVAVSSETTVIDPAASVFLKVELTSPKGRAVELPDLRDRVVGFSLAEDFVEEPVTSSDGIVTHVANWRLVPEPCASVYKVRPFAVTVDGGRDSFVVGPCYFENPAKRDPVTGEMEVEAKKDLPPLSWKLAGWCAAALACAAVIVTLLVILIRYLARRVKEHRMSPIERAWAELERLLKKGLPGRGRYKDFYVELTMVVRRYIQRKYGIRAPNLTTEEFLRAAPQQAGAIDTEALRRFLESADMVKFAGIEATPEMADGATDAARTYMTNDERIQPPATAIRSACAIASKAR